MNKEAACMAAFFVEWGLFGGVVFYLLSVLGHASLIVDI